MQNSILDFKLFAIADFDEQKILSQRRVLVICAEPEKEDLLRKILMAAKLSDTDFDIVQLLPAVASVGVAQLRNRVKPRDIIIFGIVPAAIGLQITPPQYMPFEWSGARWLFSHALCKIEENPAMKKALWIAIQKMFLA